MNGVCITEKNISDVKTVRYLQKIPMVKENIAKVVVTMLTGKKPGQE